MSNVFEYIDADGLGDFAYPYNWIDETSPYVFGPPGPTDVAIVDTVGSINGTADVSTLLLIGDGGLLSSTLEFTSQVVILEGTVALSDRDYSEATDEVEEEGASTATLTGGELYIDNPAAANAYNINTAITGSTVFDIGVNSSDQSTFNLSGAATTVLVEAGNTVIGDAGGGAMTISSGALLDDLGTIILGNQGGAHGSLTVTGESSAVYASGPILVGVFGTGDMSILAGAVVSTSGIGLGPDGGRPDSLLVSGAGSQLFGGEGQVAAGPNSTFTVADGGLAEFNIFKIGFMGDGNVLVEGAGSKIQVNGSFDTDEFSDGTLEVVSGGEFVVQGTPVIVIAGDPVFQSTFLISGLGSLFSSTTGEIQVGSFGKGVVTVNSGGKMITAATGGPAVALGVYNVEQGNPSQGAVTVTGTGSNWNVTGEFDVGYGTSGTLLVGAGGGIETGNSDGYAGFVVGNQSGSTGTATITGTGSSLTNKGEFVVGMYGSGALTISSGSVVKTTSIDTDGAILGWYAGSIGTVSVTGGSTWTVSSDLAVGDAGTGSLDIGAGSTVSTGSLFVGTIDNGYIDIYGANSKLAVTGNAELGQGGSASVIIDTGGQLSAGGTVELKNGYISLNGGKISASTLKLDAGQSLGGYGTVQASSIINSTTVQAGSGTLSFIGEVTGTGKLEIDFGATLSLGSSVASGQETIFESSTSKLVLSAPTSFASTIYDFIKGDTIDLSKIIASSLTYSGQTLTVHESGGASLALKFAGTYALSNFGRTTDDHGGTFITHT